MTLESLPKTRADALAAGVPRYFTGEPCKRGHLAPRYAAGRACVVCRADDMRVWAKAHRARTVAKVKAAIRRVRWRYTEAGREQRRQQERSPLYRAKRAVRQRVYLGLPLPTREMPSTCEACGRPPRVRGLALDHCHATGQFRGWLCFHCNTGIGHLGDNVAGLLGALEYLRKNDPTAFLDEAP